MPPLIDRLQAAISSAPTPEGLEAGARSSVAEPLGEESDYEDEEMQGGGQPVCEGVQAMHHVTAHRPQPLTLEPSPTRLKDAIRSAYDSIGAWPGGSGGNLPSPAFGEAGGPKSVSLEAGECLLFITTINMGGCRTVASMGAPLGEWLPVSGGGYDLVVVGVQECVCLDELRTAMHRALGRDGHQDGGGTWCNGS